MKKILVTGSNGQLGNEIRIVSQKSGCAYLFTDINQVEGQQTTYLDITNLESVKAMVIDKKIDTIINCAAYTNVDAAEENKAAAQKLNAEAPNNLAMVMKEVGGMLIHISTDYVFGGNPHCVPYTEEVMPAPIGVYGYSKLCGEQNIIATGCNHVIIRTSWLYSEFGKNFCKTMLHLTATQPQIKVVFDQVGTPTYAFDLAQFVVDMVESGQFEHHPGTYHYSNEGVCSWFDFAKKIAECSNQTECTITPCRSNEFSSKVARPSYSVLDKAKIKATFNTTIPYWTTSLFQCINRIKS